MKYSTSLEVTKPYEVDTETHDVDIHAYAQDNYKLTRAAWFAWYAPDLGRHDALLAEDTPPIYRRLFDAIMEGSKGLARLAAENGDELALLDYIAQLPQPRLIKARAPLAVDDLAADIFGRAAEGDPLDAIGTGEWPGTPSHTCAMKQETGTAITAYPTADKIRCARMINPTWRTCPACYHNRVKRMARQTLLTIATAGAMTWTLLDAGDYRKWAANIRQHRHRMIDDLARQGVDPTDARRRAAEAIRYRALPQTGGQVFVMSTHGVAGATVPSDKTALCDLLGKYAHTPEDARASSSRGFGGDYKRLKGDGRDLPRVRLWTDARLEKIAEAMGQEIKKGRNTFEYSGDVVAAFQRLADAAIVLRARKGQGSAAKQLLDALGVCDVTLKAQSLSPEDYPLSVTEDAPLPAKVPPRQPPLSDFAELGGAPCAIYLP